MVAKCRIKYTNFQWFLLILSATIPHVLCASSDKTVSVVLRSRWSDTSLLAETAEFIAEESNHLLWQFIDKVSAQSSSELQHYSTKELYDFIVKTAENFMQPARLDLLKFSLSVRAYSPQVEMFQQIALDSKDAKISGCESFFNVNGRYTCAVDDVESMVGQAAADDLPEVYSVDHHCPGGINAPNRVIFFGKLGTESFVKAHAILKKLVKAKVDYVWRPYDHLAEEATDRAVLSGYGVELAIKSTEYKAQDDSKTKLNVTDGVVVEEEDTDLYGFDFKTLKQLHPEVKHQLDNFKRSLQGRDEVTPLRVWQLQDLSFQAGQYVLNEGKTGALGALQEVSQNFPMLSHSLTRITVQSEMRKEVEKNQEDSFDELGLTPGESALFINGMLIDLDTTDVFSLLDILKKEEKLSAGFFRMGYRREYLTLLTNIDLTQETAAYAIDYRLGFPDFINNLDKDKQYKNWGNSVKMMVQPYFPGMIRPIARNFFTLVFIINPAEKSSQALLKIAHGFYVHEIPIRIGLIFSVNPDKTVSGLEDAGVALLNYYNFVKTDRGSPKALRHITDLFDSVKEDRPITSEDVIAFFKKRFKDEDENDVFGLDSDYDAGRQGGANFVTNTGLSGAPNVLMNGVPLDKSGITADRFEETVINEIHQITPVIQRDILQNKLDDSMNVGDFIMNKPDVMPRLNERILNEKNRPYVDMTDVMEYYPKSVYEFKQLTVPQKTAFMIKNMKYLKKGEDDDLRPFTAWVIGDFDAKPARELAYNAIKNLKSSNKMRLGFIHNPTNVDQPAGKISTALQLAFRMYSGHTLRNFVTKLMKEEFSSDLESGKITLDDLAVGGMNMEAFKKEMRTVEDDIKKVLTYQSLYSTRVLNLAPGAGAVVANGRVLGPFVEDGELLTTDDVALLEKYTLSSHAAVIGEQIKLWEIETLEDKASDVVMRTSALVMADPVRKKRTWIVLQDDKFSGVTIPASDETTAAFDVVAIVDPLTREAQKMAPILRVLQKVVNVDVKLVMNCKSKLSEMPLKSFYRLVLEPELGFLPSGELRTGPTAFFSGLPQKQLLTLHVNSPDAWLVECVHTEHDLDNIRLDQVDSNEVRGDYELRHLLLEGHCFDEITSNPPRGLQFTLGTTSHLVMQDTIVMANLGYFQLKASPGAWLLRLREGRSTDIYDITGYDKSESQSAMPEVKVLMNKFTGKILRIRVQKKPDKLEEHLLIDSSEKGEQSMWQSISSAITGSKPSEADSDPNQTINVFSLASGHLYERLLRIMMLSVLKHAKGKNPVKFWLLNNYLSPNLKKVLPHMAEHYGFEYELVQYKWPRWLHQQTEKQRTIWGYKILFLDVLFPLDVKKIIFVDADQVVRTNLRELMELDLEGAPYGYAPFCSSRTEMDGYRFWKDGYWRTHLAGRPYHISALYVVDLKKFRQIAAGDRLRGQYQGLSSDPNSLSNLDQDLPNNMIHQVKIKTLPQEWLWCETWCDDASKASAKTIDLCNNPQTKEPKLDAAKRIIAEWADYDNEIRAVLESYRSDDAPPGADSTMGHRDATARSKNIEL